MLRDRDDQRATLDAGDDSVALDSAGGDGGMGRAHAPDPDWPATIGALLDAGASTDGIALSPDDPKPPSPEVAALLRARGIPDQEADSTTGG